jgi:tRNA modification GTPase
MDGDTIFALSSSRGRAAIAIVRLSGAEAGPAVCRLTGGELPPPREARFRKLKNPGDGQVLDHALVIFFPGPHSFTGEDMAELHLHGGLAVVSAVLEALANDSLLRAAEPGEFTRRAFDNDKLDLSEVEGLADLIAAETEAQRRQALRQMEGALSRHVDQLRERLLRTSALAEALIDFSDEELPGGLKEELNHNISDIEKVISQYIDDEALGERLRDGLHAAIVGPPNAGKSSLLNALVQRDAAIVTDKAGTTRDVVEAHLDLSGFPVTLADTAGLRAEAECEGTSRAVASEEIEREGMRRARARADTADLVIAVFDLSGNVAPDPMLLGGVDARTTVVLNKVDLQPSVSPGPAPPSEVPESFAGCPVFRVSAAKGSGLDSLVDHLRARTVQLFEKVGEAPVITRTRHRRAFEDCRDALRRALEAELPELAAEDLRVALTALGRIAGRSDVEDVLERIFLEFCIGK